MSGRAVVVNRNHGIHVLLAEGTYQVVGTFLHLWVGSLNGIQFNAVAIATRINGRYGAATKSDAVVVTTDDDYLIALLGLFLQAVALGAVAHASGEHDDFVVGVLGGVEN